MPFFSLDFAASRHRKEKEMTRIYAEDELTDEQYETLKEDYVSEYNYMYDNYDEPSTDEWGTYDELVELGDGMARAEVPFLIQFARERMDPLSSDREVAAFALASLKNGFVWFE